MVLENARASADAVCKKGKKEVKKKEGVGRTDNKNKVIIENPGGDWRSTRKRSSREDQALMKTRACFLKGGCANIGGPSRKERNEDCIQKKAGGEKVPSLLAVNWERRKGTERKGRHRNLDGRRLIQEIINARGGRKNWRSRTSGKLTIILTHTPRRGVSTTLSGGASLGPASFPGNGLRCSPKGERNQGEGLE